MDILNCSKLMTNGIACQKDVKIEFPMGKYSRNENIILLFIRKGMAHLEINFIQYELKKDSIITIVPKSTIKCIDCSEDL